MKEIFIIGAYADTDEKIRMLDNVISTLKKNNKTILLSSHLTVPSFIIKNCDYFIYDKENKLITDKKYFGYVYFSDAYIEIFTKNAGTYNTSLAVLKLISNAMAICNSLNYEIIHYLEYDTILNDISEFQENYDILNKNEISSIGYSEHGQMIGNYFCFNLNKLQCKDFFYEEEKFKDLIFQNRICENLVYNYFFKAQTLLKDYTLIRNEKIKTQEVQSGYLNWGIVFKHYEDFFIFCYNQIKNAILFNIIIDDKSYNFWVFPSQYQIIKLEKNIRYIKIFGNDKLYNSYDLNNPLDLKSIIENTGLGKFNIQTS